MGPFIMKGNYDISVKKQMQVGMKCWKRQLFANPSQPLNYGTASISVYSLSFAAIGDVLIIS